MSETFVPALINLLAALGAMLVAGVGLIVATFIYATIRDWFYARQSHMTLPEYFAQVHADIQEERREGR